MARGPGLALLLAIGAAVAMAASAGPPCTPTEAINGSYGPTFTTLKARNSYGEEIKVKRDGFDAEYFPSNGSYFLQLPKTSKLYFVMAFDDMTADTPVNSLELEVDVKLGGSYFRVDIYGVTSEAVKMHRPRAWHATSRIMIGSLAGKPSGSTVSYYVAGKKMSAITLRFANMAQADLGLHVKLSASIDYCPDISTTPGPNLSTITVIDSALPQRSALHRIGLLAALSVFCLRAQRLM